MSILIVIVLNSIIAGLAYAMDEISLREAFSAYGDVQDGMDIINYGKSIHMLNLHVTHENVANYKQLCFMI